MLPDDGRDGGYTRSAAALNVSPIFLAKVGKAIDLALESAIAKYSIPPEIFRKKCTPISSMTTRFSWAAATR